MVFAAWLLHEAPLHLTVFFTLPLILWVYSAFFLNKGHDRQRRRRRRRNGRNVEET